MQKCVEQCVGLTLFAGNTNKIIDAELCKHKKMKTYVFHEPKSVYVYGDEVGWRRLYTWHTFSIVLLNSLRIHATKTRVIRVICPMATRWARFDYEPDDYKPCGRHDADDACEKARVLPATRTTHSRSTLEMNGYGGSFAVVYLCWVINNIQNQNVHTHTSACAHR